MLVFTVTYADNVCGGAGALETELRRIASHVFPRLLRQEVRIETNWHPRASSSSFYGTATLYLRLEGKTTEDLGRMSRAVHHEMALFRDQVRAFVLSILPPGRGCYMDFEILDISKLPEAS